MAENFPKLGKKTDIQFQEAQGAKNKINAKRFTLRHVITKMSKIKDKEIILEAAREKQLVTYKRTYIKLSADLSTETLQAEENVTI